MDAPRDRGATLQGRTHVSHVDTLAVWPTYPNVLLSHRLRLSHDVRFTLNFMASSPILIFNGSLLGRSERGMDWKKSHSNSFSGSPRDLGCGEQRAP